jgi:hypothetical protein
LAWKVHRYERTAVHRTTWIALLMFLVPLAVSRSARADRSGDTAPVVSQRAGTAAGAPEAHPTPRLKLSYVRFAAGNVDGTAVPLHGVHLDFYPLSWRWLRGGVEAETGRGTARLYGADAAVRYALLGATFGLQLPGRITPFVEGRLAGGVFNGRATGAATVGDQSVDVNGRSAATWMYVRGLDAGAEVYVAGRAYLSAALGWLRTTWGGPDATVATASSTASAQLSDIAHDSFFLKLGLGI